MIDNGTAWKLAYKFVYYGLVHNANIACTKLNNFQYNISRQIPKKVHDGTLKNTMFSNFTLHLDGLR